MKRLKHRAEQPETAAQASSEKDTDSLYLQKLQFDPKLNDSLIYKYITNVRVLILLAITILAAGVVSFINLPRELNPEISIPIVSVTTVLPGASPKDVESLITEKVEKIQTNLTSLDMMESTSRDAVSSVRFQFLSTEEPEKALQQVKEQVDRMKSELPDDATDPVVEKFDFNDRPFWQIAIVGEMDRLSLTRLTENIQDRLEKTPGIRRVTLSGQEKEEVVVALKTDTLRQFSLSEQQVIQALKTNNINFPAGSISVNNLEYTVSLNNELSTVDKIRDLPLTIGTQTLRLSEIADVQTKTTESSSFAYYSDHSTDKVTAIELAVYKASGQKISTAYERAKQVIDQEIKKNPQIRYVELTNIATESEKQFSELQGNFVSSILFIFVALCLFLGIRQAITASLSLPLALLSAFTLMSLFGMTLNFLSLFSLLLAVSLVGDDAIVISQATRRYSQKFTPIQTGLLVFRDFVIPIWAGTLTVVWSFLPLLLSSGIIGEVIKPIPIVVSATLLSSTAIAVFINLPFSVMLADLKLPRRVIAMILIGLSLLTTFLLIQVVSGSPFVPAVIGTYLIFLILLFLARSQIAVALHSLIAVARARSSIFSSLHNKFVHSRSFNQGIIDLTPFVRRYRVAISRLVASGRGRKMIYLGVGVAITIAAVFFMSGLLRYEFFPKSDEKEMYVNIEGVPGWSATKTQTIIDEVQQNVLTFPEVKHIFTKTNAAITSQGNFNSGPHYGMIHVILSDPEERERTSNEIAEQIRKDFTTYSEARVSVVEPSGGPPAGADFQVNLRGEDLAELERISQDFMRYVQEIPEEFNTDAPNFFSSKREKPKVINVESTLKTSSGQVQVELIPTELQKRGLSAAQVGSWLRTAISGNQASEITLNGEEQDITVTLQKEKQSIGFLQNLPLPSQLGGKYTLSEIARFTLENSPSSISRQDGQRVVRVIAGVQHMSGQELLDAFQKKVDQYPLPEGYSWDVGGANEENQKSINSIIQAMGLSFILILVTMVLQLGSFRKALIVLAIIPLAVAGVFINFTLFGIPLSFPALIGILALFGIVVNNAIMIVEKINTNLEYDFEFYDAVIDASSSRVEPIFLSSFTAVLGLLPVTISDPFWRGLGGAIIAGLSLAGILVLFLVPALFVEIFRPEIKEKVTPTRK